MARTEVTDLDNLILQVGEVQTSPTANTVLERLKQIQGNTASASINNINFELSTVLTRPANTTSYLGGQIINTNGITTLPYFDFTTLGYSGKKVILIDELQIMSNALSQTTVILFMQKQITGSWGDQTLYNPLLLNQDITTSGIAMPTSTGLTNFTSNSFINSIILPHSLIKNTDINSFIYFALCPSAGFTPISSQIFYVTIKGQIIQL